MKHHSIAPLFSCTVSCIQAVHAQSGLFADVSSLPFVLAGRAPLPALENQGIALTFTAFRLGHFHGGDGESLLKVDLRNAAGFVRHPVSEVLNYPERAGCACTCLLSGSKGRVVDFGGCQCGVRGLWCEHGLGQGWV